MSLVKDLHEEGWQEAVKLFHVFIHLVLTMDVAFSEVKYLEVSVMFEM